MSAVDAEVSSEPELHVAELSLAAGEPSRIKMATAS